MKVCLLKEGETPPKEPVEPFKELRKWILYGAPSTTEGFEPMSLRLIVWLEKWEEPLSKAWLSDQSKELRRG